MTERTDSRTQGCSKFWVWLLSSGQAQPVPEPCNKTRHCLTVHSGGFLSMGEAGIELQLQFFHKLLFRICWFSISSAALWKGKLYSGHEFCYFCLSLTTDLEVTLWNNFNLFVKAFLVFNRIFKSILFSEVSSSLFPSSPSHHFLDMKSAFRFSAEFHFSLIFWFWPTSLAWPWRIKTHTSNLGLSWSPLRCRIWSFFKSNWSWLEMRTSKLELENKIASAWKSAYLTKYICNHKMKVNCTI